MKYSYLRFKAPIELGLFFVTAGLLTFLSQQDRWLPFWLVVALAAAAYGVIVYADSGSFRAGLGRLRSQEFHLASQFEAVGAAGMFLMADPRQQVERNHLTQRILAEGNRFSLVTLTAASYIDPEVDRHWQTLKGRLDDGCSLRLLLQDPLCQEKAARDRRNRPDGGVDGKLDLSSVIRLAVAYPHQVQVRFTAANIYAAVFFSESRLTYDPYHLGLNGTRIENRFVTLAYDKVERLAATPFDHYSLLRSHFDYLWTELSQPLPEYLRDQVDALALRVGPVLLAEVRDFLSAVPTPGNG